MRRYITGVLFFVAACVLLSGTRTSFAAGSASNTVAAQCYQLIQADACPTPQALQACIVATNACSQPTPLCSVAMQYFCTLCPGAC